MTDALATIRSILGMDAVLAEPKDGDLMTDQLEPLGIVGHVPFSVRYQHRKISDWAAVRGWEPAQGVLWEMVSR